jgi:predicted Zn-dependent protease
MNAGDLAMEKHDVEAANAEYTKAQALAPHMVEIPFWCAVTLVNGGKLHEALPIFKSVFERERAWTLLVPRMAESGLLPDDPAVIKKILAMAPTSHGEP